MAQRGINKAIIIGHLGADPELKYTTGGTAVTNISVATSEKWKDKHQGHEVERTEWHRIVMFARLAEIANEYLAKGSKVYVEGRLRTRKWQGQDGKDHYTTEIIADQMQMLDTRGSARGTDNNSQPQSQTQASDYRATSQAPSSVDAPDAEDLDGDIPF